MGNDDRNADSAGLGCCPECDAEIPAGRLLARYVTPSTPARVLAECPACAAIVPPA